MHRQARDVRVSTCDALERRINTGPNWTGSIPSSVTHFLNSELFPRHTGWTGRRGAAHPPRNDIPDNGEITGESGSGGTYSGTSTYNQSSGTDTGEVSSINSSEYSTFNGRGDRTCESTGASCTGTTQTYSWDELNRMTGYTDPCR
jgi:hypothetical protein